MKLGHTFMQRASNVEVDPNWTRDSLPVAPDTCQRSRSAVAVVSSHALVDLLLADWGLYRAYDFAGDWTNRDMGISQNAVPDFW